MKDLGASPGDPVLVLALAEGWVPDATPRPQHSLAPAESGGGIGEGETAAPVTSNPRQTGEGPGGDVEGLAVRDRDDGDGVGTGGGRGGSGGGGVGCGIPV